MIFKKPYLKMLLIGIGIALVASTVVIAKDHHQKVIEFENELVEGLNKRPLDSLSEISERERHSDRSHLYRKRVSFRQETQDTLREMRYSP